MEKQPKMSDEIKINVKKWSGILAVVATLFGGGTGWTVLQYRIETLEADNKTSKEQFSSQQRQISAMETTLARIDERTKNTDDQIKVLARHLRIPTKD